MIRPAVLATLISASEREEIMHVLHGIALAALFVLPLVTITCSSDDAADSNWATDAVEGTADPCTTADSDWYATFDAVATAHAACSTANDCAWLAHDLHCDGGSFFGSCGVPVAANELAAAQDELDAAGVDVCARCPAGFMSTPSCVCVAPVQACEGDTAAHLACVDGRCRVQFQ